MTWIYITLAMMLISILIHISIGVRIKKQIKNFGLWNEFKRYDEFYQKENRNFKYYAKYIIFIVPILNLLIVLIELVKLSETLYKLIDKIKQHTNDEVIA